MTSAELNGLNAGYVAQMFEAYLDAPASVPEEWRRLFETDPAAFADTLPGLAGLLREVDGNGAPSPTRDQDNVLETNAVAAASPVPATSPVAQAPPPAPSPPQPSSAPQPPSPPPEPEPDEVPAPSTPVVDETLLGGVAAAMALVKAYRMHGHLAARLDPLGSEPMGDPALDESRLVPALTPELQARIPASVLRLYVGGETLAEALPKLKAVYTGSIAYEIEHISDHAERVWLRQAIESGRFRQPLEQEERRALLQRLSQTEGFEQYLRRSFLGQKQFSLEGLDALVPMLETGHLREVLHLAVSADRPINPRVLRAFERSDVFGPARIVETSDEGRRLSIDVPLKRTVFLFGTDANGRDLFTRTLIAGRISLAVGLLASFVALTIGVAYGAVAGYAGGRIDALMMRIVEIIYALPFIFFVIVLVMVFGRHFVLIFVTIGAVEWLDMARIVRGQTLSIKQRDFVAAAEALGASAPAILWRHVIPNASGPIAAFLAVLVPRVILLESFVSFLGLGVQEPLTSWGVLVADGARNIQGSVHLLIFPALFLGATLGALQSLGNAWQGSPGVGSR